MSLRNLAFSAEDVVLRLKQRPYGMKDSGDHVLNNAGVKSGSASWKRAAVLIALIEREQGLNVILTRRTAILQEHSGQIAFPGGKVETSDASDQAAALREAREEVSLDCSNVSVLGVQPAYYTGTGYEVIPVIGLVTNDIDLQANPDEVEEIFAVPLSFLMNPANHLIVSKEIRGQRRSFYAIPYQDYYIWGATAGMIRALYERLYA